MAKSDKKRKKQGRKAPAKLATLKKAPRADKKPTATREDSTRAAGLPRIEAADAEATALARVSQLEADRTNLMAQVAWARGVAQEQQKALEAERGRSEKLASDLESQRVRVEQLKALSAFDRLLGRHKQI